MVSEISPAQLDILKEIVNIGVGRAAFALNEMLQKHISLTVPQVDTYRVSELHESLKTMEVETLASVRMAYRGAFSGTASIVFPPDSAMKLVAALTDHEFDELDRDSLRTGTLTEVGNIVLNGVMGTMSNMLDLQFQYSLPSYSEDPIEHLLLDEVAMDARILLARAHFRVDELQIKGIIYLVFKAGAFQALLTKIETMNL